MPEYDGPALKRIEFMVLAVLADDPLHGYGIAQQIDHRTGGRERIRPGSLYRVLDRLQRRDLLEKADRRPVSEDDDDREHLQEIQDILQRMDDAESNLIGDDVYERLRFDLCADCRRRFVKDPLARKVVGQFNFSEN